MTGRKGAKGAAVLASSVARRGAGRVAVDVIRTINPVEAIREICSAYFEYKTVRERERTTRREIATRRAVDLADIQARRDVLMRYLDLTFDERRQNFSRLFARLDAAAAAGRTDEMVPDLESIVALARESPFKSLSSVAGVRAFLDDPDAKPEL